MISRTSRALASSPSALACTSLASCTPVAEEGNCGLAAAAGWFAGRWCDGLVLVTSRMPELESPFLPVPPHAGQRVVSPKELLTRPSPPHTPQDSALIRSTQSWVYIFRTRPGAYAGSARGTRSISGEPRKDLVANVINRAAVRRDCTVRPGP